MRVVSIILVLLFSGCVVAAFYCCVMWDPRGQLWNPAAMELEQLHNAMLAYKEKTGQYPPCCAAGEGAKQRRVRFMRHLEVAFPNSRYGTSEAGFEMLREALRTPGKLGTDSQPYTYRKADGSASLLDLDTLDPAEALVFWLGGFPTPCDASAMPIAQQRTYGFNLDKDNPFRRDSVATESTDPMRFRDLGKMEFKQDRFADNDDDGWLEYLLQAHKEGTVAAPFVYFDSPTYVASTTPEGQPFNIVNLGYPRSGDPKAAELAAKWGLAFPLAEHYDVSGATPLRWRNPNSFQIISPGEDQVYSAPETGDLAAAIRFSVYPSGDTYQKADGFTKRTSYSIQELDNFNNLGTVSLDEARQRAKSLDEARQRANASGS